MGVLTTLDCEYNNNHSNNNDDIIKHIYIYSVPVTVLCAYLI